MYYRISKRLTDILIDNNTIDKSDAVIYQYGFELLISLTFTVFVIIVISLFFGLFFETLLFLLGFFVVRGICGGYHAKHYYSCFISSISFYLCFTILFWKFNQEYILFCIFALTVSSIIITIFAPVENKNNPMTEYRRKTNKRRGKLAIITLDVLYIILICFSVPFSIYLYPIIIGVLIASITIIIEIINIRLKGGTR